MYSLHYPLPSLVPCFAFSCAVLRGWENGGSIAALSFAAGWNKKDANALQDSFLSFDSANFTALHPPYFHRMPLVCFSVSYVAIDGLIEREKK